MRTKKNPNSVHIKLTDRELKTVDFIMKQEGQENIAAVIHDCIRDHYNRQYFTKHKGFTPEKARLSAFTPEQLCEQVGGQVDQMDRRCAFPPESTGLAATLSIPLGDPDDMLKRFNEYRAQGGRAPVEI
jgi:hypothetical protein